MSTLVANCPRCGAGHMTFDVKDERMTGIRYDWQRIYELPCLCRRCHQFTVFVAEQSNIHDNHRLSAPDFFRDHEGSANDFVKVASYISLKDESAEEPPEHLPEPIKNVFVEGATCLAVECPNAAGAMFRVCVDIATRNMLPEGDVEGLTSKTRRDLGLRLPWLFQHGPLAADLRDLSQCIREDGNDGVHTGTLTLADAEDLRDFTRSLLKRLYTEPERLKVAAARRDERRKPRQ